MKTVPNTPENAQRCICGRCPSLPLDCREEVLYCARGKSACEVRAKGCICGACPVYGEHQLQGLYFCDKVEVGASKTPLRARYDEEDPSSYQVIVHIKDLAAKGSSVIASMGSSKRMPYSFGDLHFLPAQVARFPREREEEVNTEVIIGPRAKRPMRVASPILISGMSLGATSPKVRRIIANVAAQLRMAYNSGEGGILEEEFPGASEWLIGQYNTDPGEVEMDLLRKVAAVEVRFGQGAYPGKGSYLPEQKRAREAVTVKGIKGIEQSYSPARHIDMSSHKEIRERIAWIRQVTGGVPVGAKIGCGHIEEDLKVLVEAGVDFIALDGFGGGTGATEMYVREQVGIPIIAALPRAAQYLRDLGIKEDITLIAGGGLRTSPDFAKCLALGANAVYIATAALIAINCEQYRICHTGICPSGVTTQVPGLTKQLEEEAGARRLANFLRASTEEIANLARIMGKDDIGKLNREDLVSLDRDLALLTGVQWLDGK